MKFALGGSRRAQLEAFMHPRGDGFDFEVSGGAVMLVVVRGELAVHALNKRRRGRRPAPLRVTPNDPLVLVKEGSYRASARRWSVGFRGAVGRNDE